MRGDRFSCSYRFVLATLLLSMMTPRLFASDQTKPSLAKTRLVAERVAIYRIFFDWYAGRNPDAIRLANRTVPLDPSNHSAQNPCLKETRLQNLADARSTIHTLDPEMTEGTKLQLSDPKRQLATIQSTNPSRSMRKGKPLDDAVRDAFATGLLTVSEIAFDENHLHAFMSYGFYCGSLCGHGGNLLFEKVGGKWRISNAFCGGWVS